MVKKMFDSPKDVVLFNLRSELTQQQAMLEITEAAAVIAAQNVEDRIIRMRAKIARFKAKNNW